MQLKIIAAGLLYAGLAKSQLAYADNQAPLEKDDEEIAALFPDLDDIKLYSPAFADPDSVPDGFANGTSGPTDIDTLDDFLRGIASRHSWATYHGRPLQSEEGRIIPYVYLSTSGRTKDTDEKLRIWLQGGVHGNEPAGDQALLALLARFDRNSTWSKSVLSKADIIVLPRYNPDGVAYFQRILASNYDPNRDHAILKSQQTRDIKTVLSRFDPHVFLDAHEYTASQKLGLDGHLRKAQDEQVSHVKNLNIHEDIRALGEGLFKDSIVAALEKHDLRWSAYFTAPSGRDLVLTEPSSVSRPSHNNAGLLQAVAFLSETRGIRLGNQHFQRRVATGSLVAETLIQTAVDNAKQVYNTIEKARKEFADGDDDIIITDSARRVDTTWDFVDARNASIVTLPVQFNNNTPPEVNLTRTRPEAYIFSRAWKEVAERLRISGVEVETLKRDFEGEVEVLRVTSASVATEKYEGVAETTVETESIRKHVRIPAGGFRVSTRQKNAAFAFITLEPENGSSYATYNVVPLDVGDEYPIFRVLKAS
ncbi:hypothetical protein FDECE_4652 [Fusarium decemcellulare]|nr:hypothetical protein FDECE_4652 [Fusarium decemcellulare]